MIMEDSMLSEDEVFNFAQELIEAEESAIPVEPLTERMEITLEDAYKIQLEIVKIKKGKGQREVGKKIGLTSKRMQHAFNVSQPDYGHIMDRMMVDEGAPIQLSELIQPKIEAEIGFVLSTDLGGPGVTAMDVLRCSAGVVPTFEIVDSRIRDWRIKIEDSIADNASIGRVVAGAKMTEVFEIDLRTVGLIVRKNGELSETAAGAEVLGNPAQSVAWLVNKLSEYGVSLRAGELVISGSLISPIEVNEGDVIQAEFGDGIGGVVASFRK
jgi:2-keto-4-pentenoate hydratase